MKTRIFWSLIFILVVFLTFNMAVFASGEKEGEELLIQLKHAFLTFFSKFKRKER